MSFISRYTFALALAAFVQSSTPVWAQGTIFYVATNGNDSAAGTLASPWRTVGRAARTLVAGQKVLVRGGTYPERRIEFANSGVSGSPIVVEAYPGETPTIDAGYTSSSGINPVFWIDGRSHITLDGLTLRRGSQSNIFLSWDVPSRGITIQNCRLLDFVTEDNAAAIYLNQGSDDIVIRNNIISGRLTSSYPNSASGIIVFNAHDLTIENNDISNVIYGIYYKHSNSLPYDTIVRRNVIHDVSQVGIQWARRDATIEHNVIYRATYTGILIFEESASCGFLVSSGNQIVHNTIVDSSTGIALLRSASCAGAVDTVVRDNIISHFSASDLRGLAIHPFFSTDTSRTVVQHNVIHSPTQSVGVRVANGFHSAGSLPASVGGSGNQQSAPVFQDYAARRYALVSGPGKAQATDGTDVGAMVCAAGVNATCSATAQTIPSAPRNLRLTP